MRPAESLAIGKLVNNIVMSPTPPTVLVYFDGSKSSFGPMTTIVD